MAATRVAAYVDALVAALDAALTVPVFDGPPLTGEPLSEYVCVGWNVFDDDDATAADIEQEWRDTGASAVGREVFRLTLCAVSQGGDSAGHLGTQRAAAAALLDDVAAVVTPPGLPVGSALGVAGVLWARLTVARYVQAQTTEGVAAGFAALVEVHAQVGG